MHVEKDRQSNRKKKMGDEELAACEEQKSGACKKSWLLTNQSPIRPFNPHDVVIGRALAYTSIRSLQVQQNHINNNGS